MSTIRDEFEALLPEPVAKVLSWTCGSYSRHYKLDWLKNVPEGTELFSADQMRAAIQAATERAAKQEREEILQMAMTKSAMFPSDSDYTRGYALAKQDFAAAIRAKGGDAK